ncbi:MAG: hypothetical protein CMM91_03435 [Rickettsiales bacterium]|nr:hypothetical protein [Rickettsiales bacterium]OUV54109.1 MAG: hypothetical protein CBC87_02180 [Rickettsiales bacterium TMED127]|tara:strand:- start:77276 stop:77491 length:216 start_codon:yes stop_codon:yes gene_type:complete
MNNYKLTEEEFLQFANSGYAFIKKELHSENSISNNIFSVYSTDGTLLAAFENKDTALAAIIQSGLEPISLH